MVLQLVDAADASDSALAATQPATLPPSSARAGSREPQAAGSRRVPSITSTSGAIGAPEATRPTPPLHSPLMKMRRSTLELAPEALDEIARQGPPPGEIPDLPGARIDAAIDAAKQRIKMGRNDPNYSIIGDLGELVALREARRNVELVAQRDGTYTTDKSTFSATVSPDGTVRLTDKPNFQVQNPFTATFDVTDWAMRSRGEDPYAKEKRRYLERTFDQRVAIGTEHRRQQLARSADYMFANLQHLWSTVSDPAARKRAVCELWDEVAETGSAEQIAAGHDARRVVVNFVQMKLTGADAYTLDELAACNARRRSTATFAPYSTDP